MKTQKKGQKVFRKRYSVAIDTVPLPEHPRKRILTVMKIVAPIINQIIADVTLVAIGTWPTPEKPKRLNR